MKKDKSKVKQKYASYARLPRNYKELFFDAISLSWRKLIAYGFFGFISLLLVLASSFAKDYYTLSLAASSYSEAEKEALKVTSSNIFNILICVTLVISCIGFSGMSRIMLHIAREEPVFYFEDFSKGVKQNTKNNIVFFLLYAILLYLCLFIINNINSNFVTFIPLGILQGLFFPLLLINIETSSIYSWTLKDSFRNSFLIYIRSFFVIILFALIFSTPLLVLGISNIIVKYIILFLLIIVIYPFFCLAFRVYLNYVLDRDINASNYPQIYKMGIYQDENKLSIAKPFNEKSTYDDLYKDKDIRSFAFHLTSYISNFAEIKDKPIIPLSEPTWPDMDVINSLNYLKSIKLANKATLIKKDSYSALLLLQKPRSKVAIVMAGGGYSCVCTLPEDLPVSIELYKKGFSVVSFNYSVAPNAKNANNDLRNLVKFLIKNQNKYNIDMDGYFVVGFSAAGHLAASSGTDNFAVEPKPKMIGLGYPVITMQIESGTTKNLLGDSPSKKEMDEYCIEKHVANDFPPTFIWQNEKDNVVPFENSLLLVEQLKKNNIKYVFEHFDSTAHGWGIATNKLAEGWIDRMIEFYLSLDK